MRVQLKTFTTNADVPSRLYTLDLGFNALTGPLPQRLGPVVPKLHTLQLGNNRFEGEIPTDLCQNCEHIDLSWNRCETFGFFLPVCVVRLFPNRFEV